MVASLAMAGPLHLPLAGAADGAAPNTPASCTNVNPITLGAAATDGSIATAGQVDCYTFAGIVGDRVHVQVVATDGTLVANTEIDDPSDTTLCGPTTDSDQTCQLATSGTHTIVIDDSSGTNTGDYTVFAEAVHPACTSTNPITIGAPATDGAISSEGQADCYTFTGSPGDRVHIQVIATDGTLVPDTWVADPNDATLCGPTTDSDQTCQLATGGTQTIVVHDSAGTNTGDYTVFAEELTPACTNTNTIKLGAAATAGDIGIEGQADCYTFGGNPGDRVHIQVAAKDGTLVTNTTVLDPTGATVCGPTLDRDRTCLLTAAGTYTILIRDSAATGTGNYTVFAEVLTNGCTDVVQIGFGATPMTGSITSANDAHCYSFIGKVHDHVVIRVVASDGTLVPSTTVLGPKGTIACAATTDVEQFCTMSRPGTQMVMVRDADGTNTGDYTVYIQRLLHPLRCTAITFGVVTTGSITIPGQTDCFTFRSAAGRRLTLRVVATDGTLVPNTEVVNATGGLQCGPTVDVEQSCRMVSGGNQMVMVRDLAGPNLGSYNIYAQVSKPLAGCTPIKFGATALAGAITIPGDADCYTFKGVGGDQLRVRVVPIDGSLVPYTEVIKPNGMTLCGPATDIEQTCRLTATGTNSLFIRDQAGPGTGDYTVSVQRLDVPVKCTAIAVGAPALAGSITVAGDAHCYTFNGTAGQRVQVEVVAADGTIQPDTELVKPDGITLLDPATDKDRQARLPATGTYCVIVRDLLGPNTGSYTVAVSAV